MNDGMTLAYPMTNGVINMATAGATVLFAGGGTGGHIFPSLAIAERLRERHASSKPHFVVSNRPLDAQVLQKAGEQFTAIHAKPVSLKPWDWPGFASAWFSSVGQVGRLIQEMKVGAVVAMGGFVSAPAVSAARRAGVPVLLVNLDAVPGRANRMLAKHADEVFSVYRTTVLPHATIVGLPLRRSAVGPEDVREARSALGLDPERPTLFVTGASQGATSINAMMMELVSHAQPRRALQAWQILHLTGDRNADAVRVAYEKSGIPARVETFCNAMGHAWRAATIAISRAGAGSVAEAWANAIPTIFLPYPYHKDQHQRLNAEPMSRMGAALLYTDLIHAESNARQISGPLLALMSNSQRRTHMAELMRQHCPPDGADAVATWLINSLG